MSKLYNKPMALEIFFVIAVMCLEDSLESIRIPKYLTRSFCSIAFLFINIVTGFSGLFFAENITKYVFETFRVGNLSLAN